MKENSPKKRHANESGPFRMQVKSDITEMSPPGPGKPRFV